MKSYKLTGTNLFFTEEAVSKIVNKALYSFKRAHLWFVRYRGEDELFNSGWQVVLTHLRAGFRPDFPETYLFRLVYSSYLIDKREWHRESKFSCTQADLSPIYASLEPDSTGVRGSHSAESQVQVSHENLEDAVTRREIAIAVVRCLERMKQEGDPKEVMGVDILCAEAEEGSLKVAIKQFEGLPVSKGTLWRNRRLAISRVREDLCLRSH